MLKVNRIDAAIPASWSPTKQLTTAYVGLDYVLRAYLRNPPPAYFTLLESPLVMWIWIGGLIVLSGGLIAIWLPPARRCAAACGRATSHASRRSWAARSARERCAFAALLIAALLSFVAWLLSGPFRRRRAPAPATDTDERRALESARDAKYAEIHGDNETDHRTGKLSDDDYRALDRIPCARRRSRSSARSMSSVAHRRLRAA